MSSSSDVVAELADVAPLTAGRGGPDSWERDVRVMFGVQTFDVLVRGSPLMNDHYAVEVAREAVVEAVDPDASFVTGHVRPDELPDHKQRIYSRGDLARILREVARDIDGCVSEDRYDENKPDGAPWSNCFRQRFGSWSRAREVALDT